VTGDSRRNGVHTRCHKNHSNGSKVIRADIQTHTDMLLALVVYSKKGYISHILHFKINPYQSSVELNLIALSVVPDQMSS